MEFLPPYRVPFGWEQQQHFRHPDRYEEDVEEIVFDSPFLDLRAVLQRSHTTMFSFLVVGDQNSGKSTLLHLLCCSGRVCEYATCMNEKTDDNPIDSSGNVIESEMPDLDETNQKEKKISNHHDIYKNRRHDADDCLSLTGFEFLQLASFLPVLSSSFINSRWLFNTEKQQYFRDKLPYLDTDVARGLLLMNADDFRFFCFEFQIPFAASFQPEKPLFLVVPNDSAFVGLQFIEMGGDHLDRLIEFQETKKYNEKRLKQDIEDSSSSSGNEGEEFQSLVNGVLTRSLELLNESSSVLYFINAKTLFSNSFNGIPFIDADSLKLVLQRFTLLAYHRNSPLLLHLLISRLPEDLTNIESSDDYIFLHWIQKMVEVIEDTVKDFPLWSNHYENRLLVLEKKLKTLRTAVENESGDAFVDRTPFLEEWGEEVLCEKEIEVIRSKQNFIFRTIRVIVEYLFLDSEVDGTSNCVTKKIQLLSISTTRNYEIEKESQSQFKSAKEKLHWTVSVHGIISTIVRILKSQAMRLQPSSLFAPSDTDLTSVLTGELGFIMLNVFLRLASLQWMSSQQNGLRNLWLSQSSMGKLFDSIEENHWPSLLSTDVCYPFYNIDNVVLFIRSLCVPLTSLVNLWEPLCYGLLKTTFVLPYLSSNYPPVSLDLIPIQSDNAFCITPQYSKDDELYNVYHADQEPCKYKLGEKKNHDHNNKNRSTKEQSMNENSEQPNLMVIRLPFSQQFMAFMLKTLRQQIENRTTLPMEFWEHFNSNSCSVDTSPNDIFTKQIKELKLNQSTTSVPISLARCFKEAVGEIESQLELWEKTLGTTNNNDEILKSLSQSLINLMHLSADLFQIIHIALRRSPQDCLPSSTQRIPIDSNLIHSIATHNTSRNNYHLHIYLKRRIDQAPFSHKLFVKAMDHAMLKYTFSPAP